MLGLNSLLSRPAESLPLRFIAQQNGQGLSQAGNIIAVYQKAILLMPNHLRDAAGPVTDARHTVGPGFEQDQPKGIRTAWQGE